MLSEGEKMEQVHASVHRLAHEDQAACAFVALIIAFLDFSIYFNKSIDGSQKHHRSQIPCSLVFMGVETRDSPACGCGRAEAIPCQHYGTFISATLSMPHSADAR